LSIAVKDLLEAGVHFGHQTKRWNPKMKPFIYDARNGIHLIDLEHTQRQLKEAGEFLKAVAKRKEPVLFVGCKKPAQQAVKDACERINAPYVSDRWLGGALTNLQTIRKSVKRLDMIENLEKTGEILKYPRKEASVLRREKAKLMRNLSGMRKLEKIPGAVVIVDIQRETNALAEAKRLHIPVIAIVDTNADPLKVEYPIVGNDDAIRSIKIIVEALVDAMASVQPETAKQADVGAA